MRRISKALDLDADLSKQMASMLPALYKAFVEKDMSLLEVNPLVITKDKKLICLDAKVGFDDNALFRHPDVSGAARRHRGGRQGNRSRRSTISIT